MKCPKCGEETKVFNSDLNGNMVCHKCFLTEQKQFYWDEPTTAEKLLWLASYCPLSTAPDDKKNIEISLVIGSKEVVFANIKEAYNWAKEQE